MAAEGASCREGGMMVVVGGWVGALTLRASSSPDFVVVVRFLRLVVLVFFFPATRLERSGVDLISQVISRERDEQRGGREGRREGWREGK